MWIIWSLGGGAGVRRKRAPRATARDAGRTEPSRAESMFRWRMEDGCLGTDEAGCTATVGKNEPGMSERMLAVRGGCWSISVYPSLSLRSSVDRGRRHLEKKSLAGAKWGRGGPTLPLPFAALLASGTSHTSHFNASTPNALVVSGIGDGALGFSSVDKTHLVLACPPRQGQNSFARSLTHQSPFITPPLNRESIRPVVCLSVCPSVRTYL